ncbi:hypothetical protein KFE25_005024 [Diacronema lutheri]|uniref:Uncharacterized protein n=1 Tax=Diacronema lutheri TaxID=2081491 RepID=A0A8J5XG81_DIALT|nr:hypothetical protein KFE25_005024 [Diacronema lutheri]
MATPGALKQVNWASATPPVVELIFASFLANDLPEAIMANEKTAKLGEVHALLEQDDRFGEHGVKPPSLSTLGTWLSNGERAWKAYPKARTCDGDDPELCERAVANPNVGQAAINSFFNHLASFKREKKKSAKLKEDQARVAANKVVRVCGDVCAVSAPSPDAPLPLPAAPAPADKLTMGTFANKRLVARVFESFIANELIDAMFNRSQMKKLAEIKAKLDADEFISGVVKAKVPSVPTLASWVAENGAAHGLYTKITGDGRDGATRAASKLSDDMEQVKEFFDRYHAYKKKKALSKQAKGDVDAACLSTRQNAVETNPGKANTAESRAIDLDEDGDSDLVSSTDDGDEPSTLPPGGSATRKRCGGAGGVSSAGLKPSKRAAMAIRSEAELTALGRQAMGKALAQKATPEATTSELHARMMQAFADNSREAMTMFGQLNQQISGRLDKEMELKAKQAAEELDLRRKQLELEEKRIASEERQATLREATQQQLLQLMQAQLSQSRPS